MESNMSFAFATCERRMALQFLRKLNPSHAIEDTPESAADLLNIIEADELRVCDPDYHSGSIIQGQNFNDSTAERARASLVKTGIPFA